MGKFVKNPKGPQKTGFGTGKKINSFHSVVTRGTYNRANKEVQQKFGKDYHWSDLESEVYQTKNRKTIFGRPAQDVYHVGWYHPSKTTFNKTHNDLRKRTPSVRKKRG